MVGFESHEPSSLAVSSAGASLTNSPSHALRAASMAHKPSISKSPEQQKTSPTHALKAASAADRDSTVRNRRLRPTVAIRKSRPEFNVSLTNLRNENCFRTIRRQEE